MRLMEIQGREARATRQMWFMATETHLDLASLPRSGPQPRVSVLKPEFALDSGVVFGLLIFEALLV